MIEEGPEETVAGEPLRKATRLDQLNRWLTLAASLGVLVGIGFVVVELRQNTVALQSTAAISLQASSSEIELLIAGDHDFAEVLRKGRDGEDLTPTEELRLLGFYRTVLRNWQNKHYQYLADALDEELWQGEFGMFTRTIVADRGLYAYWYSNRSLYSPTFNQLMESITSRLR